MKDTPLRTPRQSDASYGQAEMKGEKKKAREVRVREIVGEGLLTIADAASWLSVCDKTVRREIEDGALGFTLIRGTMRVPISELFEYVQRRTVRGRK
jgi:excisionase family DNA binding protein